MHLNILPYVIILYISNFLSIKDCISLRAVCRHLRDSFKVLSPKKSNDIKLEKLFYLNLTDINYIPELPVSLRILKVFDYETLTKFKTLKNIDKIIIQILSVQSNYNLIDVRELTIKKLIYNSSNRIYLRYLQNIQTLNLMSIEEDNMDDIIIPEKLNNLYCKYCLWYGLSLELDYLEAEIIDNKLGYIKKIKLLNILTQKDLRTINIPMCDELIIDNTDNHMPRLSYNTRPKKFKYLSKKN